MAKAKAEAAEGGVTEESVAPAVEPSVEVLGQQVPVDSYFVTPVDRSVAIGRKVFEFKANVPRQLPEYAIVPAIGMGIQVAS